MGRLVEPLKERFDPQRSTEPDYENANLHEQNANPTEQVATLTLPTVSKTGAHHFCLKPKSP